MVMSCHYDHYEGNVSLSVCPYVARGKKVEACRSAHMPSERRWLLPMEGTVAFAREAQRLQHPVLERH